MNALDDAVDALYARKQACAGGDGEMIVVLQAEVIRPLLLDHDIDPEHLEELQGRATVTIIAAGLNASTIPSIVAGGWMEGFLLGLYVKAER
jgi:hypothetical protein